jgi:hypothetical protein
MRRRLRNCQAATRAAKLASALLLVGTFALAGRPCSANATVIIKTFQFSICVTGNKHPDACKNVEADAHVVVSEEKMESLDSKIGQAASIMAAPVKGAVSSPSGEDRHQHHRQGQLPIQPGF